MRAGAVGFATSKVAVVTGASGRSAQPTGEPRRLEGLVTALGDVGAGIIVVTGGPGTGFEEIDNVATVSGRPVYTMGSPDTSLKITKPPACGCRSPAGRSSSRSRSSIRFRSASFPPFEKCSCPGPIALPARGRSLAGPGQTGLRPGCPYGTAASPRVGRRELNPFRARRRHHPRGARGQRRPAPDRPDARRRTRRRAEHALLVVFGNDDVEALGRVLADDLVVVGISDAGAQLARSAMRSSPPRCSRNGCASGRSSRSSRRCGTSRRTRPRCSGCVSAASSSPGRSPTSWGSIRRPSATNGSSGARPARRCRPPGQPQPRHRAHLDQRGPDPADSVDVDCRPGPVLRGGGGPGRDRDGRSERHQVTLPDRTRATVSTRRHNRSMS